jgi:eukaryotic-like serine/threonine-protein kinase
MPPERFGRYEVIDEIGDGAMGRVYRAWDPAVKRVVAVKTVKTEYLTRDTGEEYLKRFRREAQAAGGLSHPAIVRVFDLGDDHLVMELVEGRTLHQMVREQGRIAPGEALRLLAPVAEAVDHAHRQGIVHRDIKPANIMVQPDGQPKLMDFGVARIEASVMTTAGQILGSPSYMSPEQIAGQEVTGRSDVYSLAVVAYEMLTGQPPFQGNTITQVIYRVMHDTAPPPRQWNASLPARYDDVFARALAKDPELRFATALEFVTALDLREIDLAFGAPQAPAAEREGGEEPTVLSLPPDGASGRVGAGRRVRTAALLPVGIVAVAAVAWLATRSGPLAPVGPAPEPTPVVEVEPTPAAEASVPETKVTLPPPSLSPSPSRRTAAAPTPEPVVEGQLVELGPGVTPPVRLGGESAAYPEAARRRKMLGTVAVEFVVDESGVPTDLRVSESAGEVLDDAVLEAVRSWRFEPARKDGVRVKVRWQARHTYRAAP